MARASRRPPLLAVLAELYASIDERDVGNVERVCELNARRLPREVREEAMAVVRTPAGGHRAPIRLLVFWRAARAMAAAAPDDRRPREQLELDLRAARTAKRRTTRANGRVARTTRRPRGSLDAGRPDADAGEP